MVETRTISIYTETAEKLIELKINKRETYDDVISRLIGEYEQKQEQ